MRREAVEQAGPAEMVLGPWRRLDEVATASGRPRLGEEVEQLDDARLHRHAGVEQARGMAVEVMR